MIPTIQKQSVAEHSFHVAHIALWLSEQREWDDGSHKYEILYYALIHDETEAITGDIPSPAGKLHLPGKSKAYETYFNHGTVSASKEIQQIIKMADCLEALLFCNEEYRLGNRGMEGIHHDIKMNYFKAADGFKRIRRADYEYDHHMLDLLLSDFLLIYDPSIHPVHEIE